MTVHEASTDHPLPLHIKLAILSVALAPLCVVFAILELAFLPSRIANVPALILLTVANFIPLAAISLRYVRFERRWITPAVVANGFLLIGSAVLISVIPAQQKNAGAPMSPPRQPDVTMSEIVRPSPPPPPFPQPTPQQPQRPQPAEVAPSPSIALPKPPVLVPFDLPLKKGDLQASVLPPVFGDSRIVNDAAKSLRPLSKSFARPKIINPASSVTPPASASTASDIAANTVTKPARPSEQVLVSDTIKSGTYWNSWLDNNASADSKNMIVGNTYTITLDLSAFDYTALRKVATSSSVPADESIARLLADLSLRDVYLTLKPVIPEGSGLRLKSPSDSYFFEKIDRERLLNPDREAAKQYRDKQIEIVDLSRKVSAVSFPIVVTAEAAGCATIAFSIFDGFKPLDHLVQRVAIGDSAASAPTCDVNDPAQIGALSGGLDSLREVNLGIEGSTPSFTAAGAFHIFDNPSWSMAVFVDGRPGQSQSVYGWQTDGSVIDVLRKDSFQALIQKARTDSANKTPGSYVAAARELEKVLFRAKPGTSAEATKAEAAFRSLVKESSDPPVIVVRVADSAVEGQNRSLYLPLGILGAQGPNAVLDKPITVVQPMAIERYAPKDRCIGEWTFAIPPKLQDVPDTVMPANFFPAKFPGTRLSKIDQLRPYLASPPASPAGIISAANNSSPVGFVVLAHQDDGNLWFDQSTDHIVKQDIDRTFPLGSVAIFAACSVASPKGRNNELLQKLNERGVDTMIVSPFAIDALYGVTFAASFADVLEDATERGASPTILELYNQATARTGQKFKDKNNGNYADLGLEYVLLGNSAITLCKPASTSTSGDK